MIPKSVSGVLDPAAANWNHWLGADHAVSETIQRARRFSAIEEPILILGETGTGKSLLARIMHAQSMVAQGPFVEFPCSSFNENLIESELFGHVRGAFTGAHQSSSGKILLAHNGTLFLDEIGELSLTSQTRLLHFLQEGRFYPVGSHVPQSVRVRIIAATNRNLRHMADRGQFREDLFFRLNVMWIRLPALRERKGDILALAQKFIREFNQKTGTEVHLGEEAKENLLRHSWPGNVRELQNCLKRSIVDLEPGHHEITKIEFAEAFEATPTTAQAFAFPSPLSASKILEDEFVRIKEALIHHRGHLSKAAESLGLSRYALARRLKKLGFDRGSSMARYLQELTVAPLD